MEIRKLILHNFRCHKSLTIDFEEGITHICGINGTGKSRIIEAIVFLFTGEGYGKAKSEMLTVGEESGYVVGHLLIEGKEAILERHVDTTKVALKYDGKTLKKSTEVNQLWEQLFQIDKNLVQSVVVSNQGEISLLFNGDNATKEKLFQKIFMVPNTTRLRAVIWDNYLKTAPPEYPVKDLDVIRGDLQSVEQLIKMDEEDLAKIVVDEASYKSLVTRTSYLRSVANSAQEVVKYTAEIRLQEESAQAHQFSLDAINAKMALIDIADMRQAVAESEAAKRQWDDKQRTLAEREALIKQAPGFKSNIPASLAAYTGQANVLYGEMQAAKSAGEKLAAQLADYKKSGLSSGTCPTCGTKVDSVVQLIAHAEAELIPLREQYAALANEYKTVQYHVNELTCYQQQLDAYAKQLAAFDAKLTAYADVVYSVEDHQLYVGVVRKYAELEKEQKEEAYHVQYCANALNAARVKLAGIPQYDNDPALYAAEVQQVEAALAFAGQQAQLRQNLQVSIQVRAREVLSLQEDLRLNQGYIEKNKQRAEYVSVLTTLYDLFHTAKFPRALINTYASTVNEYMNSVLESFDFPYTAKVNESFGIDVFNEEGLQLPCVSGGEQVMIGFSLRLALHNMFVGAFPFMIIDEGSYGLATDAAQKYFEIIASLGKSSKFKQVIIIDHHKELSDYTDNTITLTKVK